MSNSTKTNVPVESPTMLDDFWNLAGLSQQSKEMQPPVNVQDTPNKYELQILIPGLKKKDFKIRVEHGQMSISGESKLEENNNGGTFSRKEFSCSSINGTFSLPEDIDEDMITAKYKRGILKIKLKKTGNGSTLKQKVSIQ